MAASLLVVLAAVGCSDSDPPEPPTAAGQRPAAAAPEEAGPGDHAANMRRISGLSGTAYYETSPAQGRPPDGELSDGTVVELVEEAGSYSRVKWELKEAWVASDALQEIDGKSRPVHKIPTH